MKNLTTYIIEAGGILGSTRTGNTISARCQILNQYGFDDPVLKQIDFDSIFNNVLNSINLSTRLNKVFSRIKKERLDGKEYNDENIYIWQPEDFDWFNKFSDKTGFKSEGYASSKEAQFPTYYRTGLVMPYDWVRIEKHHHCFMKIVPTSKSEIKFIQVGFPNLVKNAKELNTMQALKIVLKSGKECTVRINWNKR